MSHKYKKSWETKGLLKEWIQAVPHDVTKAYCHVCHVELYAHKYSVLKHTATMKHQTSYRKHMQATYLQRVSATEAGSMRNEPTVELDEETPHVDEFHLEDVDFSSVIVEDNKEEEYLENDDLSDTRILTEEAPESCESNIEQNCVVSNDTVKLDNESYENETCSNLEFLENSMSPQPATADIRTISSHILDTSVGKAAANVPVTISRFQHNEWLQLNESMTNADGRVEQLLTLEQFSSGIYKLHFDVRSYFEANNVESFYPFIEVVVNCTHGQHYHIPLLLNPFGYSTYRGT